MLAGVAVGLADYFDIDPTLVRVGSSPSPSWVGWPFRCTWPDGCSFPKKAPSSR